MLENIKTYLTSESFWSAENLKKIYLSLVLVFVVVAFFVPLLRFPKETSSPWPEAYEVIQQEIINQQKVPPSYLPQYAVFGRSDMTYFLVRDLSMVNFKLISGLPYETIERFLSFAITIATLIAVYYFFTTLLPPTVGFFAALLYLFSPRLANYYPSMNGEFFSFAILFLALCFSLDWIKSKKIPSFFMAGFLVGFLPVTFLIHLGIYCLVMIAAFISYLWQSREKMATFKISIKLFLVSATGILFFSILPLTLSGDIRPGASSSIGSMYSKRSAQELSYEKKYYQDFFTYGSTFYDFPPFVKEIYFLSFDAAFIDHFAVLYLSLFAIGLVYAIKYWRTRLAKFVIINMFLFLAMMAFFYSPLFNQNVYNIAQRILLYFSIPMVITAAFGLGAIYKKSRLSLVLLLVIFIALSFPKIIYGAFVNNSYLSLYPQEYKDALAWLEANVPPKTIVISNEETMGQFWLKAGQLNLVEGSKGSAVYFSYEQIYNLLNDGRILLDPKTSSTETKKIIDDRKIRYVVIWNRPTAFELMPYINAKSKLENLDFLTKVFEERGNYDFNKVDMIRGGSFTAEATIYKVEE